MRLLFVAPEYAPLAKTGGLGDVIGALPAALGDFGIDVRVLLPGYPGVLDGIHDARTVASWENLAGLGSASLLCAPERASGRTLYVVRAAHAFERPGGIYADTDGVAWLDNAARFALLCHVAARLAAESAELAWRPEIVHAHDWHTGLLPAILAARGEITPASIFTVHNAAFQGNFPRKAFAQLGLPASMSRSHALGWRRGISLLKAGVIFADRVTTVSPTYAWELSRPPGGAGMEAIFAKRAANLVGILNGIDTAIWNPGNDPHLPARYNAKDPAGKRLCKQALERELGFESRPDRPLLATISRLSFQKGLDLLVEVAPMAVARGARLVLLGVGDADLVAAFRLLAQRYPEYVAVRFGFDEPLAHRIEAGADAFIMPSRFEPCGLSQLYSMRYGTIPLARQVGGLADSIVDATPATIANGTATGVLFVEPSVEALTQGFERLLSLWEDAASWASLRHAGMSADFSWRASARRYVQLYTELLARNSRSASSVRPS